MKPVPIKAAKAIAEQYGLDGVAIFIFSEGEGQFGATSYGADKAKCKQMGKWIDAITDDIAAGKSPFHDHSCPWPTFLQDGEL